MRESRCTALACVLLLAASAVGLAQPRPPTFRARTVVTQLEVHVTDGEGRPVTGLGSDDFEVREDGVLQTLLGADATVTRAPSAWAGTPGRISDSPPGVPEPVGILRGTNRRAPEARTWAIVVDDLRTPGLVREQVKACLRGLIDAVPADDSVALVPTSGSPRSAREFTLDRGTLRQAIDALRFPREFDGVRAVEQADTFERPPTGIVGPVPGARLELVSADNLLVSSLGNASAMLGRASAPRPTVVLVSPGMALALSDDYRRTLVAQGGGTALRRYDEWREALARVQRSGVTVHVIDPIAFDEGIARRVRVSDRLAGPSARMRGFVTADDPRAAVRAIAHDSGGLVVREPDPALAARRVIDASSAGYLLRYIPRNDALDDRLRAVTVHVRRPGVSVRARTSYARISDPEFERLRDEKPLGVAVAAVVPSVELGLEATAEVGATGKRSQVHLAITVVEAPGVPLPPRDMLEVLAVVVDMKGKSAAKMGGRTEVVVRDGTLSPPEFVLESLKPGRYQVRVAVRSVALDLTGSVFLDLDIAKP
jgi:VWFA-related protein